MKLSKYALLTLFIILLFSSRIAQAKIIEVTATGSYTVGDGKEESFSIAKDYARMEAKRAAVEQAGVYIESYSEVNNMTLTKDEIRMLSANILKVKSEEFIVTTKDNKFIMFLCKIIADIDTDSVYLSQSKELNAMKEENAVLRQMIVELQQTVKNTQNMLLTNSFSQNIEKSQENNQYSMKSHNNDIIPSKETIKGSEPEQKPENEQKNQNVLNNVDNIVVSLFPDEKEMRKLPDFLPKPAKFVSPTPKVSMNSASVVPNPEKWRYMFYNSAVPDGQPVWYSPSSIRLIKRNGNIKVSFTILRYRASYNNYYIQNVLIDYANEYYMTVDKKFYTGGDGTLIDGQNFDNVQVRRKIDAKNKEAVNYATYIINLISAQWHIFDN